MTDTSQPGILLLSVKVIIPSSGSGPIGNTCSCGTPGVSGSQRSMFFKLRTGSWVPSCQRSTSIPQDPSAGGIHPTQPKAFPPGGTTTSAIPTSSYGTPIPKGATPTCNAAGWGSAGSVLTTSAHISSGLPGTGNSGLTKISSWAYHGEVPEGKTI